MTEQLQLQKQHGCSRSVPAPVIRPRFCPGFAAHVLTIERYRTLADSARVRLEKLGYDNIEVLLGDGFDIPAGAGDFDRIIVTAAMEQIPEKLLARLEPGGILIAPVGPHQGTQTLIRVTRTDSRFRPQGAGRCPLRAGAAGDCPRTVKSGIGGCRNILFQGLSGYLLRTCLLKRVFCCVQ